VPSDRQNSFSDRESPSRIPNASPWQTRSRLILLIFAGFAAGSCVTAIIFSRWANVPRDTSSSQKSPQIPAETTSPAGAQPFDFVATKSSDIAQQALSLVARHLQAGEVQYAYDALLAAMRIEPNDERVFEASLAFVRQASSSRDDESLMLADDVYQRAENLIPFLPLSRLEQARKEHAATGSSLAPKKSRFAEVDPLIEVEKLLDAATVRLPTFVRTHLLREAESTLSAQATRPTSMKAEDQERFCKRWKTVKARLDEAQNAVLASLYQEQCQPRVRSWLKKVDERQNQIENANLEKIHEVNTEILDLVASGQQVSRDLAVYLEAGVPAAIRDNRESSIEGQLMRLSQLREWNYNRWALDRVESVEQSGGGNLDRLRSVAVIDESRLAPYVGQRLAEVWKKFFDECSKEDKIEATKLRILREYQK
jgi:hypothetical protein